MGGGAMRAATKVAGIAVANGGLRGITSEHYPVFSASRWAASSRPAASTVEEVKLVASQSRAGLQGASLEIEDWVFAGGEEEATDDLMPRVVFGLAPTLQEAKEATSELTVALEKISSSKVIENKACGTSFIAVAPAVPAHAIKAFRLLNESSVAQNVVASIACDTNVWNAVLQNQELQEFLQSQKPCFVSSNMDQYSSAETIGIALNSDESQPDSGFMDFLKKMKIPVVDMLSSLSDYFQKFFGGQRIIANSDGTLDAVTVMEASFMGLAIMAIMVIILKRV